MPLYEYVCPTCHNNFEKLRSMEEGRSANCPDCGTVSSRVLSLVAARPRGASDFSAMPVAPGGMNAGASCCGGACACE